MYSEKSFLIEMNLVAGMRAEYCRAERLLWVSVLIKAAIYVATLTMAVSSDPTTATVVLIAACTGQACLYLFRFRMQQYLSLGERLRRLAMLQDGVGREVSPLESAVLQEKIWNAPKKPLPDPYYTSQFPQGPKRLIDLTAECAFFSGSIGKAAGRLFKAVSIVASSILVLSLILVVSLGVQRSELEITAKVVLLGITFWMTEDLLEMSFKYASLGDACERILHECSRLLEQSRPSTEDAYVLLHEYDAAVAGTPPLPGLIYRRRNSHLSEIWRGTRPSATAGGTFKPGFGLSGKSSA
jgi:hypothetical protein